MRKLSIIKKIQHPNILKFIEMHKQYLGYFFFLNIHHFITLSILKLDL
jgi:hypothetical protein